MENINILDLQYSVFFEIQTILDHPGTMTSFLEVLPPECSCENVLISMDLESKKYNMTPAKVLLNYLGSKGFGTADLIKWFQDIGLEKALILLKKEEPLVITAHPEQEVTINEGGEILLTCTATSYPPPEYQWFKDDVEMLLQVDSTLRIKSSSLNDSGQYICLVTKWNGRENAYDWQYSECCTVHVVPRDLRVLSSFYQEPQPSVPNFVLPVAKTSSPHSFDQDDEVMSSLPEEKSVLQSDFDHNGLNLSSKKDVITITKHPYAYGKISPGMTLCLTCEAVSTSLTVNYLWIKNGRPLHGETSSQLILKDLYPDPYTGERNWRYQCEVYNEHDRVISDIALVELDEVNDTTPFVARQKYAFMVANDTYDYLEHLKKPAADVKDLASMLSSVGFKIFAFRNLTLTEMRNAFHFFCEMLVPGSYALFFFAGHGFDICGQTYLQPIDSSNSHLQHESMCAEYILQCMQERKPAVNIFLIDACRKLPPNISENSLCQRHGKIFDARMKNNTIFGYSTSFLCASHESDEEANSVFVKHLKKYILQNKSIQDIIITVQNEFSKDPLTRNVQFPVIKSTLAEKRKLSDSIQEPITPNIQTDIVNWCDIKRDTVSKSFEISRIKATIQVEFHHHMGIFCNGTDAHMFLHLESDAEMFILRDMEINITFISPALHTVPTNGTALKDVNLLAGKRNFLFKKEILNVQKINTHCLEGDISLKFRSKNFVKNIPFKVDAAKIVELQLSINHLQSNNVEKWNNYTIVKNSFK